MFNGFGVLLAATTIFTGCSSDNLDNSGSSQLSKLQEESFKDEPDQVLSRTATGNFVGGENFSHADFIKTTKQLANNALLSCRRCPFEVLLTPFRNLTEHLLNTIFATV